MVGHGEDVCTDVVAVVKKEEEEGEGLGFLLLEVEGSSVVLPRRFCGTKDILLLFIIISGQSDASDGLSIQRESASVYVCKCVIDQLSAQFTLSSAEKKERKRLNQ